MDNEKLQYIKECVLTARGKAKSSQDTNWSKTQSESELNIAIGYLDHVLNVIMEVQEAKR